MASPLSLDDTVLGNPAPQMPSTGGLLRLGKFNNKQLPAADHAEDVPRASLRPASATGAGVVKSLGPTPDSVAPELMASTLPTQVASLPNLRQDGSVYKTKDAAGHTAYSGSNVHAGAPLLDGMGRPLGTLRDSGLGTPGNAQVGSAGPLGDQMPMVSGDGMATISGTPLGLGRTPAQQQRDALTQMSSIVPTTRAVGAASAQMVKDNSQLDTTRYVADQGLRGHMYGADKQLEGVKTTANAHLMGNMANLRMQQMGRMAQMQAMQQAGGDPRKAASIMATWGFPADALTGLATAEQGWEAKGQDMNDQADKSAMERAKAFAVPDEKGGITPAALAKVRTQIENMVPGYFQGDPAAQSAAWPSIEAKLHLLNGLNERRSPKLLQSVGWDRQTPEHTTLPNLEGAKLRDVSGLEGATTGGDVSGKDYAIEHNGHTMYLPKERVTQGVLDELVRMKVDIGKVKAQ
jgi:hypothetical protein